MSTYLLTQSAIYSDRQSLEISLMGLKAVFIRKLGTIKDDPLLDAEQIARWFFRDLSYSLQELIELIEVWDEIGRQPFLLHQLSEEKEIIVLGRIFRAENIRDMRIVKNKLKIVTPLFEDELFSLEQRNKLQDWIILWGRLP